MSPARRTANHYFPPLRAKDRTGWRRWADRLTRALGPSWRAAPLRRAIQTASLLLFVYLFFYVSWPYAETFTSEVLPGKERLPVESFLWLDPLVGVSAAIAARTLSVALVGTAAVFVLNVLVPRGFCGYICPMGTLVDLFDWALGRKLWGLSQFSRSENGTVPFPKRDGWWIHLKYYLLSVVLVASGFGVLLSGFVSAIPVVTRGMSFTLGTLQLGWLRSWTQVRGFGPGDWLSIGLFLAILAGGLLRKRFWCRYVCPTGALFSLAGVLRLTHRRVETTCAACGRCVEVCPFDAIAEDYSTRTSDCAWCQTCGGACPVGAIQFVGRIGDRPAVRDQSEVRTRRRASRRGFLAAAVGGAAAALGLRAATAGAGGAPLLRPPGSVAEPAFLDLCVRCGQCLQVCPGPVLQPAGLGAPLEALWTPVAVMTHAGCHQDCNFCTLVCPTRAIRPLSIDQKRKTSMGLAVIDRATCLPHAGLQDCRLCIDECDAAGYGAIESKTIRLAMDDVPEGVFSDEELEQMGRIDAPFVDPAACVGCGLCEYRCHTALVKQEKLLAQSAVRVVAENVDR